MNIFRQTARYDPSHLLDCIAHKLATVNDKQLANIIGVNSSTISKIRTGRSPVSAAFLIRVNELTGLEIEALRSAMGDRRKNFRINEVYLHSHLHKTTLFEGLER